jgi:hypothetical protein
MSGGAGLRRFVASAAPTTTQTPAPAPDEPSPVPAPAPAPARALDDRCELCATEIPAEHGHVADLESSSLICACRACYLLFTHSQAGRGRYRSVPDRYLADPAHPISVSELDTLDVPVGLAFFLCGSAEGADGADGAARVTGFYPSPAGATECRLDLPAWDELASTHPMLGEVAPDVEAILISRSDSTVEYFIVPIDACYELAGRMRLHWRGFDGGSEARASIAEFLAGVRVRARARARAI